MNTTSIAKIDAKKGTPTAIATHTLSMDEGTGDAERATAAICPLFRLPRELRDEIYGLAAQDERTLYCDITLRADRPSQKTAYVHRGARRTLSNSQFEVEYSEAIARRVKSLVTGHDRNGFYFSGPGPTLAVPRNGEHVKVEEIWLEVSKGQQDDYKINQNIHTLMLAIPLWPVNHARFCNDTVQVVLDPCGVFAFKFPDKAELGPRRRFDCHWDANVARRGEILIFPSDDDSVLQ